MEDLKGMVLAFGTIGLLIVAFVCIGQWIHNTFLDNVPIQVKVDGKTVYSGISAGVDVASSGANTTVTIHGGPLYFFPKAYYVSRNVEVVGDKR